MVIAHHLMWTAYGYWLPNDPRGSMSHEVLTRAISNLGPLHYGRKAVQPSSTELRDFRRQAEDVLTHELLSIDETDFSVIARCLGDVIRLRNYTCYACAIMPDHVHVLIRKHRDKGETMIEHFQRTTREALIDASRRPPDKSRSVSPIAIANPQASLSASLEIERRVCPPSNI